jgi:hypothetical protein
MAENTKTPPNQDQRQRTPQSDKPQKPGNPGSTVNNPDRDRQGPDPQGGRPTPESDPAGKNRVNKIDDDKIDDDADLDDITQTQRQDRNVDRE